MISTKYGVTIDNAIFDLKTISNEREHTFSYSHKDGLTVNMAVLHGSNNPRLEIVEYGHDGQESIILSIPMNMLCFLKDLLNRSEEVTLLKDLLSNSPLY